MVLDYTEDFGVTWRDAAASASTWIHNANHFPNPLPPMGQEVVSRFWSQTFGVESAWLNGYSFARDLKPLFSLAAGVVTDTGGVLSHSAICAREFAIPCVVATQVGTKVIPDGAMITIDGAKGTVVIED